MEIKSVAHTGLRKLTEDGVMSGVPAQSADKLEAMVAFLLAAPGIEAIQRLKSWKAHPLTGDRKGAWSLTVSRNWRMTFTVNADSEIEDLDFEDYH